MNLREAIVKAIEEIEGDMEVWYGKAGRGEVIPPPYIIVQKMSGIPDHTFQGTPLNAELWMIKCVGDVAIAETVDDELQKLLPDVQLVVDNMEVKYLRVYSDINYPEPVDGEQYQHIGANYRVTTQKEES